MRINDEYFKSCNQTAPVSNTKFADQVEDPFEMDFKTVQLDTTHTEVPNGRTTIVACIVSLVVKC